MENVKNKRKSKTAPKSDNNCILALKHKKTPLPAKAAAAVAVGYALSPVDLIPDFIPILGLVDDIILVPLLIKLCLELIPNDIYEECKQQAEYIWKDGKPEKWYYAIPIVMIWLLITGLVIYNIIKHFV